jgi:hypothetical protein
VGYEYGGMQTKEERPCAAAQPTDCPAQRGGAERQPPTELQAKHAMWIPTGVCGNAEGKQDEHVGFAFCGA